MTSSPNAVARRLPAIPFHSCLRRLASVASLAVAGLLLIAATAHLFNGYQLLASILNYRLLPVGAAAVVAGVLPYVQLTLGVALLFVPQHRRAALASCVALFAAFVLAQASAYARGLDISCGCFGDGSERIGWRSIAIAGAGLVLSGLALVGSRPILPALATRAGGESVSLD